MPAHPVASRRLISSFSAALMLALLVAGAPLAGCVSNKEKPVGDTGPAGAYHYTAYDRDAQPVLRGTLTLSLSGDKVAGSWAFQIADGRAADAGLLAKLGPQIGAGELVGNRGPDGQLQLNLNPDRFDNNVLLDARYDNRILSGAWTYTGFAGPRGSGSFTATKQ